MEDGERYSAYLQIYLGQLLRRLRKYFFRCISIMIIKLYMYFIIILKLSLVSI